MLAKIIIVITMLIILGALLGSLVFLVRDKGKSERTVKALTWRIGLSLSLFVFLFLAFKYHWIAPHDLPQQQTVTH
jgi:Na+-driven multidrug efflux pump